MGSVETDQASGEHVGGTSIASTTTERVSVTKTLADLESDIAWEKSRSRVLRDSSNELHSRFSRLHGESLEQVLRHRTVEKSRNASETLAELASLGFAWSAIARIVGVTVAALRKWRSGEPLSGANRRTLAEFAAACEIVSERNPVIQDVAGWLEMPLCGSAPITGIDLLAAHRYDLVFRYANNEEDPEAILDEFEPNWRERYASDIEVFTAADGMPALRMRDQD